MKLTLAAAISLLGIAGALFGLSKMHPTHHDAVTLAANAKGEVHVLGTLATLGSFEWDAAPLTTHAASLLLSIPQALHDKKLTVSEAQARINHVDHAHDLIVQALKTCRQNEATGKCAGDDTKARALLDRARLELAAIP